MNNPLNAEFVDVIETTEEIIDKLDELLCEEVEGDEESFECGGLS
jgi:hypothetical protein